MRRRWWSVVALLAVAGSDDAPVACGCGLDGDWPEAPSKAPPDWLRVPRQSSAWAVTMVLALPACRGAPARGLREASACGPRDACVFDALKRSGDRCAYAAKRLLARSSQPPPRDRDPAAYAAVGAAPASGAAAAALAGASMDARRQKLYRKRLDAGGAATGCATRVLDRAGKE